MDVVKCLYAIGSVVILLVGQVSAAPLAAVAEAGIVAPPPGFILKMDTTTDDLGKTTTSASPIVKSVTDLQYAIKWFRSYKYLPQVMGYLVTYSNTLLLIYGQAVGFFDIFASIVQIK